MLTWVKNISAVTIFFSFLICGCGGDGDKGTGPGNGDGGGSLTGTWRVQITASSEDCPYMNFSDEYTETYTEEDTDPELDWPEECDCDMLQNGNQYTIDCTCTYPEDPCLQSTSMEGGGTLSENSYNFTYTITWVVSDSPECSYYPACTVTYTIQGTRTGTD